MLRWLWNPRSWALALPLGGCADDGPTGAASTSTSDATSETSSSSGGATSLCEDEGWYPETADEGAEDTSLGMGDDMPLPFTVEQVQRGEAASGARIAIAGVITVTPAAPSEARPGRELFVQDPAGGPYSGLRVVSGELDLGELLAPGDQVDLVGEVISYRGFVLLEIVAASDVLRVGPSVLPEPTSVSIDELAAGSPSARQYEGVFVQVVDATVTDTAPCDGEFVLDDILRVDDRFVPGQLVMPSDGARVSSVRGVFVRASGSYELAPPEREALQ
ncbi:MAG: hypothetical protein IAG13_06150 [Deltaproteobacteria bacterium]|nr:hypothetical protein [Nannocystaceae bacterium]